MVRSWLELDDAAGESTFILREDKDDPATETLIRLHPGMQLLIDTERLLPRGLAPGPAPALRADHLMGDQRRAGALG